MPNFRTNFFYKKKKLFHNMVNFDIQIIPEKNQYLVKIFISLEKQFSFNDSFWILYLKKIVINFLFP